MINRTTTEIGKYLLFPSHKQGNSAIFLMHFIGKRVLVEWRKCESENLGVNRGQDKSLQLHQPQCLQL